MSCSRSLVVDVLPIHKQQVGASWCKPSSHAAQEKRLTPYTDSRLAAFGNVLGYSIGSLDLVAIFGPSFGDTQFKKLSLVATFAVLFTCSVTCWAVTEKVLEPRKGDDGKASRDGIGSAVRTIVKTVRNLPPRVRAICWAHFWSWIGEALTLPSHRLSLPRRRGSQLTGPRLVPLQLLRHHLGRRDLLPLRCPGLGAQLCRRPKPDWPHRQHLASHLFLNHPHKLVSPPALRALA